MPASSPSRNDAVHADAVAWLRFDEEEAGGGIRAALFQTSGDGEPTAFCFARIDLRDPSIRNAENPRNAALSALAGALFRAADPPPPPALALADELPDSLSGGARPLPPMRRVSRAELENAEPFDRAAIALAEAFADPSVQALSSQPGLMSVTSLTSLPGSLASPGVPSADSSAPNADPRGLTLAERLWRALAAPLKDARPGWSVRLEWVGDLMPFQMEGVNALVSSERLLLADDMGLGKTLQTIAAARILKAQRKIASCLVVAPSSLLDQWRREIEKWAPELSAIIIRGSVSDRATWWKARRDVTLVGYETLRSDFDGPARQRTWDVVVADEAQRIKNRNDTSAALKGLPRRRSWALTGTPIENHEEELASILEFVDYDPGEGSKRYAPGPELMRRHEELQLRRKKSDVLHDLPDKLVSMTPIELGDRQRKSYDKAEEEGRVYLRSLGAEVQVRHILELITRLKQICNADPETGESSKLDDIRDRVELLSAQGHKALVFSQYVTREAGVEAVVNRLREFAPLAITGATPQEERTPIIERFKSRGEHKALVLSLRVGGLGLNLQEASYVFHLDRWWNPAVERQAEDRSHRIGQTVKVNVIKYSCVGTIEERIDRILERKQGLFDQLIDDVSLDLSAQLNREEMFGLFGLEPPPR